MSQRFPCGQRESDGGTTLTEGAVRMSSVTGFVLLKDEINAM